MAHKLWLQYAQMLSNHCNSRILVSAIFSRLFWNITCLDLECKQCKHELDIMYYSAVANCLNYLAHIPKPCIIVVGVAIRHIKLACRTPLITVYLVSSALGIMTNELLYASRLRPPRHNKIRNRVVTAQYTKALEPKDYFPQFLGNPTFLQCMAWKQSIKVTATS